MKLVHVFALSAGLAGAALFAGPTQAQTALTPASLSEFGADAQTAYSAAEVGVARRAYRDQCSTQQDPGVCECLAAAYAQELTPPELHLAAAMLNAKASAKARANNAFANPESRAIAVGHIEGAAAKFEPVCRSAT